MIIIFLKKSNEHIITELQIKLKEARVALREKDDELNELKRKIEQVSDDLTGTNGPLETVERYEPEVQNGLIYSHKDVKELLNNIQQIFFLIDTDFKVLDFNEAGREYTGKYTLTEVFEGCNYLDHVDESVKTRFIDDISEIISLKKEKTGYKKLKLISGESIYVNYKFAPLFNSLGDVDKISLSYIDRTKEILTRERHDEREKILHSIYEATDAGIALIDEKGIIIEHNLRYSEVFFQDKRTLTGMHFENLFVFEEDKKVVSKGIKDFEKNDEFLVIKEEFKRTDGTVVAVNMNSRKVHFSDGKTYVVNTVRDVTSLKNTRKLLEETQNLFKIGGWEFNILDKKATCTEQVYEIFEIPSDFEITKETALRFFSPEGFELMKKNAEKSIKESKTIKSDLQIKTYSGAKKWIRFSFEPVLMRGMPTKIFGTIQDISEEKVNKEKT